MLGTGGVGGRLRVLENVGVVELRGVAIDAELAVAVRGHLAVHDVAVAGEQAVLHERHVLVEVELRRLAEELGEPDHDHDADEQVDGRGDLVQVAALMLERVAGHVVAQADRAQRYEAVVEGVQIGPVLDRGVHGRRYDEEEHEHDERAREREEHVHAGALHLAESGHLPQLGMDQVGEGEQAVGGDHHESLDQWI